MGTCVAKIFALLCFLLPSGTLPPIQSEKHSLYYIYTNLSKPVDQPGIYQFSAMGLLDERQIHSYNSEQQNKFPTQHYWEKGTQSEKKCKEQWFNVNLDMLMKPMIHNESDLHVHQWRIGCEVEQVRDEVKVSKGVYEYGYDGENFLSFDENDSQWVASVDAALPTKRKWDNVPILNQFTKGYLEKECVDWLNTFRDYDNEEQRKASPPDVRVFTRKSSDETKLKLTCLATGFYSKDVTMTIRKHTSPLPEYEVISSGNRPNHDKTFQMKKSVEINEDEQDEYDCFLSHRTFKEPIIVKWDGKSQYRSPGFSFTAAVIGGLLLAAIVGLLVYILKKKCGQAPEILHINTTNTTTLERVNPSEQDTDSGIGEISATCSQEVVNQECEDSSNRPKTAEAQSLLQENNHSKED